MSHLTIHGATAPPPPPTPLPWDPFFFVVNTTIKSRLLIVPVKLDLVDRGDLGSYTVEGTFLPYGITGWPVGFAAASA